MPVLDRRFLEPRSVVVVGASPDPDKLSGRPLRYLQEYSFDGSTYAVNPRYDDVLGVPCLPRVAELPAVPDLAFIGTPAQRVPDAVRECGEFGVGCAVVAAAGFAEAGDHDLDRELRAAIAETGIRVVGPNSLGTIAMRTRAMVTFTTALRRTTISAGHTAVVSQSGGMGYFVLEALAEAGVGVSNWISAGNEVDLGLADYLDALIADPHTRAIVAHVEGFGPGTDLLALGDAARKAGKPLIMLKVGRSGAGQQAARSHTGKLLGDPRVLDRVLDQAGIVSVSGREELVDVAGVLARSRSGQADGTCVVSTSGGLNVLLADAATAYEVPLAQLGPVTTEKLGAAIPGFLSAANPLDLPVVGRPDVYEQCLRAVIDDPSVGTALLVQSEFTLPTPVAIEVVGRLAPYAEERDTRLVLSYFCHRDRFTREDEADLARRGVLIMDSPERALRAIGRTGPGAQPAAAPAAVAPSAPASTGQATGVPTPELIALLERYQVPCARSLMVHDAAAAASAAGEIGYPVALKLDAPDLAHKTEIGGVILNVPDADAVRETVPGLLATGGPGAGVLVQRMAGAGVEVFAGISVDQELGPILALGAGGVLAELTQDISYRALPVTAPDVRSALAETKVATVLGGHRNGPVYDVDALVAAVLGLVELYQREPITEVELNPVIVAPEGHGVLVVDALAAGSRS